MSRSFRTMQARRGSHVSSGKHNGGIRISTQEVQMKNYRVMTLLLAVATFSGFAFVSPAQAGTVTTAVTVAGTDMPWNWVNLGLNTSDQFGINDGSGPVVISATNGFAFNPGDVLTLTYLSGMVSVGSSFSSTNANGDTALPTDMGN